MSKHTPAPWEVVNADDVFTPRGARNAEGVAADDSDGWYIADCSPGGSFVGGVMVDMDLAERKANARLIAAAPLLLNELQLVLDWAQTERAPLGRQEIESIRAAIAKATGA